MNDKYKLECIGNYVMDSKFKSFVIIYIIAGGIIIGLGIINLDIIYYSYRFIIPLLLGLIYIMNSIFKFSPEKFKKYGKKQTGYITKAWSAVASRHSKDGFRHHIEVTYQNGTIDIPTLKDNKAFRTLKMLLDPCFIKPKIPIDVYVFKNKLFADIESVDLTKVEGFNEVKDIK